MARIPPLHLRILSHISLCLKCASTQMKTALRGQKIMKADTMKHKSQYTL